MTTETVNLARLADILESLRRDVARLGERVAALEARAGAAVYAAADLSAHAGVPAAIPVPSADGLSEELVLVLSAAIAAYLGKKAPIRGIRLLGSATWSHQGRLTIQASHERVLSRSGR